MNRSAIYLLAFGVVMTGCEQPANPVIVQAPDPSFAASGAKNPALESHGKTIFRFDTYGNETFWTDTLLMHEVIRESVSPTTALSVGLKVDADALPASVKAGILDGTVKLDDPATTVALIGLNAVVGVVGKVENNVLVRVGVTCALCHSTVNNSFAPGIGSRLDGWPNRDLNVGAIIALSPWPGLTAAKKAVYNSWGPGMYDPRYNIDGQNIPVVLPPAFGLRHVSKETYTGDDDVSYWNAYVAITQMHGHGQFVDPRIGVSINNPPDLVSAKLPPLRAYQLSLETPAPPPGTSSAAAHRGRVVFNTVGQCARCHLGGALTDVNANRLHAAAEVGQDPSYALRSVTKLYRTTPLRGLWNPPQLKGPYFHDGSAATLEDVVDHYVPLLNLNLTANQKSDLVAYLRTL
jgi:mono/diheme cytochrome c family protein